MRKNKKKTKNTHTEEKCGSAKKKQKNADAPFGAPHTPQVRKKKTKKNMGEKRGIAKKKTTRMRRLARPTR